MSHRCICTCTDKFLNNQSFSRDKSSKKISCNSIVESSITLTSGYLLIDTRRLGRQRTGLQSCAHGQTTKISPTFNYATAAPITFFIMPSSGNAKSTMHLSYNAHTGISIIALYVEFAIALSFVAHKFCTFF